MSALKDVKLNPVAKKKILLVDDSEFIQVRLLALFSETETFGEILQAKNSDSAYSLFYSSSPDIVVLDIHIPGDNGLKVLERLKKIKPDVHIFMLTNYSYMQYRKRCLDLGADHFFVKSDDMNSLVELCEKVIINS